ncbi:MAG: hypothetical protein U0768_14400 [Anaerolineae bacterium]
MNGDSRSSAGQSRAELREKFDRAFSIEELKLLCDDLGMDPADIPGQEQGKTYWISQIILYFERRNQIAALLARAKQLRPNMDWTYTATAPDESPLPPISPSPGPRVPIAALYLGVALLAVVVVAAVLFRPWSSAQSPSPATLAPTPLPATLATAPPPATFPPGTPTAQSPVASFFNVAVADFGQFDDSGQLQPSKDGQRIAQALSDSLKLEFNHLDVNLQQDFKPRVQFGDLGLVRDDIAAEQLAQKLHAHAVVYGNLTAGQSPASLAPRFYVSKLRGEAEEMVGRHSLGEPLPLRLPLTDDGMLKLNVTLTYRQKLLTGFTLGLLYDLLGQHAEAQKVLTKTWEEVKDRSETEGKDVLQYFIGREYLFLANGSPATCSGTPSAQTPTPDASPEVNRKAAEEWFQKTLAQNPKYARGYIGLAGVNYQKARAQTPAERLKSGEALDQSIANYTQALEMATAAGDTQIAVMANLGLGNAHQIRGDAILHMEKNYADADKEFDQAIERINQPLQNLGGQYRLLVQGFSTLGIAYEEAAASRQRQTDKPGAKQEARDLYQKALEAYNDCTIQRASSPDDSDIAAIVRCVCSPRSELVNQALKSLE